MRALPLTLGRWASACVCVCVCVCLCVCVAVLKRVLLRKCVCASCLDGRKLDELAAAQGGGEDLEQHPRVVVQLYRARARTHTHTHIVFRSHIEEHF